MTPPRTLAITPPAAGPWLRTLHTLPARGVDGLLIRLLDTPDALSAVLAATPPGLAVLIRPASPAHTALAAARKLGLHLPSRTDPRPIRRQHPGLLSAACHDRAELLRAEAAGVDMALLSPVFSPGSKPDDDRPTLGISGFLALSEAVSVPVLALGGITAARAATLRAAGAYGVAGISTYFPSTR